jgi:hypothetical protein
MSSRQPGKRKSTHKIPGENPPGAIPEPAEIAYNLREGERPDGVKVRFKITMATGEKSRELDARQAEAIRRLPQWAQHNHSPDQT